MLAEIGGVLTREESVEAMLQGCVSVLSQKLQALAQIWVVDPESRGSGAEGQRGANGNSRRRSGSDGHRPRHQFSLHERWRQPRAKRKQPAVLLFREPFKCLGLSPGPWISTRRCAFGHHSPDVVEGPDHGAGDRSRRGDPGDRPVASDQPSGRSPAGRRVSQPGQKRIPRQHEPRDSHPDERCYRHDGAGARHRARCPPAGVSRDCQTLCRLAADRHQ